MRDPGELFRSLAAPALCKGPSDKMDLMDKMPAEGASRPPPRAEKANLSIKSILSAPPLYKSGAETGHSPPGRKIGSDPKDWRQGVGLLVDAEAPPAGFEQHRWDEIVTDALALQQDWGDAALGSGWTTLDLFGCDPDRPDERIERKGLALIMRGENLTSIAPRLALIRRGPVLQSVLWSDSAGRVPLWEILP